MTGEDRTTPRPLTVEEVERYRRNHEPDSYRPTACSACRETWPCGGARIVATLDRLRAIEEAARLPRNVILWDGDDSKRQSLVGEWVAVPREAFDALRATLEGAPHE